MSRASSVRQRDLEKVLAAAKKQGIAAAEVVITRDGDVRIQLGGVRPSAPAPIAHVPETGSDFDRWQNGELHG